MKHRNGNAYDPTRRPWYARAVASKGKYTISTPYIDSGGAGLLSTLSTAIFEYRNITTGEILNDKVKKI